MISRISTNYYNFIRINPYQPSNVYVLDCGHFNNIESFNDTRAMFEGIKKFRKHCYYVLCESQLKILTTQEFL